MSFPTPREKLLKSNTEPVITKIRAHGRLDGNRWPRLFGNVQVDQTVLGTAPADPLALYGLRANKMSAFCHSPSLDRAPSTRIMMRPTWN